MQSKLTAALFVCLIALSACGNEPHGPTAKEEQQAKQIAELQEEKKWMEAAFQNLQLEYYYHLASMEAHEEIPTGGVEVVSDNTPTTDDAWAACTRDIESNGDYSIIDAAGVHFGAYQFKQSTWDSTAEAAGRPDLVGVRPSDAAPSDQDFLALFLFDGGRGAGHWGGRCL